MAAHSDRASFSAPRGRPSHVPGKLVIKLVADAVRPHLAAGRRTAAAARAREIPDSVVEPFDFLERTAGLSSLDPMFPEAPAMRRARAAASGGDALRLALASSVEADDGELSGLAVATLAEDDVAEDVIRTVEASPSVQYVETLPVS